jgi:hypothetical protein
VCESTGATLVSSESSGYISRGRVAKNEEFDEGADEDDD